MGKHKYEESLHKKEVFKMLDVLEENENSIEFKEPVPWERFGLTDYPTIITWPMCLQDVRHNLK